MVKLFDMVLGKGNILPSLENCFHSLGIASNFLLVARLKFLDFQLANQSLNLAVGQLTALDAGR